MVAEGELRSNVDDSERVKELQDEVAYLKAEVRHPHVSLTEGGLNCTWLAKTNSQLIISMYCT